MNPLRSTQKNMATAIKSSMHRFLCALSLSATVFAFSSTGLLAQPVNKYTDDVVLPSPNAAALGKYGDIPVGHFTGVPNIGIPIFTVEEGPLSLPISLGYHASGLKVAETASWAGAGWSLNAGGTISRTVMGIKDEDAAGYFVKGDEIYDPVVDNSQFNSVASGLLDAEPDLFSFNLGGYAGKFVYDMHGDFRLIPKQDIHIKKEVVLNELVRFTLTVPDGTRYHFGNKPGENSGDGIEVTTLEGSGTGMSNSYNSSWHLVQVESADRKWTIDLEYAGESYSYTMLSSCYDVKQFCTYINDPGWPSSSGTAVNTSSGCNGEEHPQIPGRYVNLTEVAGKRLSRITNSSLTHVVDFIGGGARQDLDSPLGANVPERLGKIKVSSGGFCHEWKFSHSYFKDPDVLYSGLSEFKKLKLEQVAQHFCDVATPEVPPYVFTYEGPENPDGSQYLPNRLSKAIDHWGFYNGADANNSNILNIPPTTVDVEGEPFTNGDSDRDVDEEKSKYGTLKRMAYPTGGHTDFTFGANVAPAEEEQYSNILHLEGCTSGVVTFTAAELPIATFDMSLVAGATESFCDGSGSNDPPVTVSAEVKAYHVPTGDLVGSHVMQFNPLQVQQEEVTLPLSDLEDNPPLEFIAGEEYEFVLTVESGDVDFSIQAGPFIVEVGKEVGGLRIEEIRHDAVVGSPGSDVVLSYEYELEGQQGKSSGELFFSPFYGYVKTSGFSQASSGAGFLLHFRDNSLTPMGTFEGYHIGYSRVVEVHSGNGRKVFEFHMESAPYEEVFPTAPPLAALKNGTLMKEGVQDEAGSPVRETVNAPVGLQYESLPGVIYKTDRIPGLTYPCGQGGTPLITHKKYSPRTGVYQVASTSVTQDGVTVTTDYEYNGNSHLFLTAEEYDNKKLDGTTETRRTEYYYPGDEYWQMGTDEADAVAKMMVDDFMYMPGTLLRTVEKVNNNEVGGSWTEYKDFDNDGLGLYPQRYHSYKGGWYEEAVVESYTDGLVHKVTMTGWEQEEYTWTDGLLTHKKYIHFEWDWLYHTGSRLLDTYTDIDGQATLYTYDGLMRLETVKERDGRVETIYSYGHGVPQQSRGGNFVHTHVKYSGFDDQYSYSYFDGLGRAKDTWRIGYGPGTENIVTEHFKYDDRGRVEESVYLQDIKDSESYTLFEYEESPLGRQLKETYPDGHSVGTEYGSEAGSYYLVTVTDENGNTSATLTDKAGRQLEARDAKGNKTVNDYDDRDNLVSVTNPEGEVYSYSYDARNRMVSKYVPGQVERDVSNPAAQVSPGCNLYLYDDRNLVTATQDPNMRQQGTWLGSEYDLYGRVLKSGFGSPVGGTGLTCFASPTEDRDFIVSQALTTNTYDLVGITGGDCDGSYTPTGKLVSTTTAVLLPGGGYGTPLETKHCYDEYGRIAYTVAGNILGSTDTYSYTYDIADHLTEDQRKHNGGELDLSQTYTFDHGGRMIGYGAGGGSSPLNSYFYEDNLTDPGNPLYGAGGGASHTYNTRDQLVTKLVGGLAELNYMYNSRGWLTHINNMPFDHGTHINSPCEEIPDPPGPPSDPGDTRSTCASCPEGELTLPQLLQLRFKGGLNVDCYQDCECSMGCAPEDVMPCPDSAYVSTNGDTVLIVDNIHFPTDIYHLLECTGKESWVQQGEMPSVSNRYAVLGRYHVEDGSETFRVSIDGTDVIMDLAQMLETVQDENAGDVQVKDGGGDGCGGCSPDAPDCSPADSLAQESALANIQANLMDPGLTYQTFLKRVRLCGGAEVYLFEEELEDLPAGSYIVLQTISVESAQDEIVVTTDGISSPWSITLFLCTRDLDPGWIINYYKPCEDNECGNVGKKFYAKSAGPTNLFSTYYGDAPYFDLSLYPNPERSLEEDLEYWDVGIFGTLPSAPFEDGESEWDMGVSLAPDANLLTYEVHALLYYYRASGGPIRLMLHDGTGPVKVNGGLDFMELNGFSGDPNSVHPMIDLVFVPDALPTPEQAEEMKVVLFRDDSAKGLMVDAVYAKVDYTEPCDRCVQEELTCTPAEQLAQAQALQQIENAFEGMSMEDIPVPTNLYRVRLCNGDEVYLLHHELDMMPQPYQILQVIGVEGFSEPFNGGLVNGNTPTMEPQAPGPPSRDDLFAMQLDYYSAKDRQELFAGNGFGTPKKGYKNGNIAQITWQMVGRDRQIYSFDYDELDRLTHAAYADRFGWQGGHQLYNFGLYKVSGINNDGIVYDEVGNIKQLARYGVLFDCDPQGGITYDYGKIDELNYKYEGLTASQLTSINDISGNGKGFNGTNSGDQAYGYDRNGNMTDDLSKGLTALYNHLDLPRQATTADGTVKWTYAADGRKLKKESLCNAQAETGCVTIEYVDGIEFHHGKIDIGGTLHDKEEIHLNHAEGRATYYFDPLLPLDPTKGYWQGEHVIRDHLGNTRLTFADKNLDGYVQAMDGDPVYGDAKVPPPGYTEILQEDNYYPFGMLMEGPWRFPQPDDSRNKFGYNGKELDTDIGLDWHHYGARIYLSEIGRFTAVDPLASDFENWSTYSYTFDNPIRFIDPDGRAPESCPGCGWLLAKVADKLEENGYSRTAGVVDAFAGLDLHYSAAQSGSAAAVAETPMDFVKAADPTGLTSLPETVSAAMDGNERAQGQLIGGAVIFVAGAKTAKVKSAGTDSGIKFSADLAKSNAKSRSGHRNVGNKQLNDAMKSDSEFRSKMEQELGTDVYDRTSTSGKGRRNPNGYEWDHNTNNANQLDLRSKENHAKKTAKDPGRQGGYSKYWKNKQ